MVKKKPTGDHGPFQCLLGGALGEALYHMAKSKRQGGHIPALDERWASYENEIGHYFMHEPGAPSSSLEPQGTPTAEPKPPRFPIGADYYLMMTAWSRLCRADQEMPYANCEELRRPSCSMVLRAAYGTQACRYDDQAPDGEALLAHARNAYCVAAAVVPPWVRRSVTSRILARFDRHFGTGEE